jgi:uncharacterized membrane protein
MRSDEQRDRCIDVLFERIKALEVEVASLKGGTLPEEIEPSRKEIDMVKPREFVFHETPERPSPEKPQDSSLESAIGTRWIGRIGMLAILFGVAFFLKYSFDNRLIGETGRVILGIIGGIAFIGAGEYFQKKKNLELYGQMLSGGGLAVLYLALYASFALYHLIPVTLAAVGMIVVTTTGMTLSIRYSTYSLAAIALLGGFLTPFMLSTGENQPVALFGYIMLLDAGTLMLIRFRRWPSLVAASLAGTVLLYASWHSEFFTDEQRWLAFGVIALFFLFYNLYVIISRLYSRETESNLDHIVIFGSAAFFFMAFFAQYGWECTWPVKTFSLLFAAVAIGLAELVRGRAPTARMTISAYTAVSVIMTVVATFVVLEQRWLLPALAAEMAALAWIGFRLELPMLRAGSYVVGLLALIRFADDIFLNLEPFDRFMPVLNSRFLVCGTAVAGFYGLMALVARNRDRLTVNERYLLETVFIITQVATLALLSFEVHDYFRFRSPGQYLEWGASHYAYQLFLSVLWALYASMLTGIGILKRIRGARVFGILLLGVTVMKVFLVDLSSLRTFYRIISFVVLGLLLLAVSYAYNRFKHLIFGEDNP